MTWWSKLFFLCPEDIFEEILFFLTKFSKLSVVSRLWGKHFGLLAKIIWLGFQNCFQVSRGYIWKSCFLKTISLNCLFLLGLRAQTFQNCGENFPTGLSKLHSMCPVEFFDWTVFFAKIYEFSNRLRAVKKKFWHAGAKASKSLSKLQFMCTKSFCGKFDFSRKTFTNFSSTDRKFCGLLSKNVE